jgi:microcystin-dependent protein
MAGNQNITLLTSNLPQHTHPVSATLVATSAAPNTDESSGAILAGANIYAAGPNGQLAGVTIQCGVSGQNQPVDIQQPYLGLNFVICTQGIFPSRG